MDTISPTPRYVNDWPLALLIIALDDAERCLGPAAQTTRTLAYVLQDKLRKHPRPTQNTPEGGRNGR
jgi:hypothetical protein